MTRQTNDKWLQLRDMKKPSATLYYYDGNCPMCTAFVEKVSKHNSNDQIFDVNKIDPNVAPATKEELLQKIYIKEPDGKIRTGADAIMTSLSRIHPVLKPVSFMVRLPLISWFSDQVYSLISQRRLLLFGNETARLYWLFLVTSIGLLSGLTLTYPLWSTNRTYPLAPIFSNLDSFNSLTFLFFILLTLSLFISIFAKKHFRKFALLNIILLTALVFLDITRLQPWVWHYGFILLLLTWWNEKRDGRTTHLLDAVRIVVVGIYLWSGIQKLNVTFMLEDFPWFTESLWAPFGDLGGYSMIVIGIFTPFLEALLAIGLLTKKFRKISIIISALMLFTVILSIMLGHHWNSSVWPWNFALFAMVLILFYRFDVGFTEFFKRNRNNTFAYLAGFFFILMPIGNLFDKTDHYLSWSLYSGQVPVATIGGDRDTLLHLVNDKENLLTSNEDPTKLTFLNWSMETMNVVPYPENRVFKQIFSSLCEQYPDSNLQLEIKKALYRHSNKKMIENYDCDLRLLSTSE